MKICGKKLGRLKQKKNVLCYNCSFQRSPSRNSKKAQIPNYKNVLTQC